MNLHLQTLKSEDTAEKGEEIDIEQKKAVTHSKTYTSDTSPGTFTPVPEVNV